MSNKELTEEQRRRLEDEDATWGPVEPVQLVKWVGSASSLADGLANATAVDPENAAALFWIRLYGSMHEVADSVAEAPETTTRALALAALQAVAATLSPDELLYVQARRHTEAHPLQSSLRVRQSGGTLVDTMQANLRGDERVSLDEVRAVIRRVELEQGKDRPEIAAEFARKVQRRLDCAYQVMKAWCDEEQRAGRAIIRRD